MTLSTLNVAAQSADAAIAAEEHKLRQIIDAEDAAMRELNKVQGQIQKLRGTEQEISNYLADKGRDRAAQEKRIKDAKSALNEQAEALIKTMANYGLEAPQPVLAEPIAPQRTIPDDLGLGDVPNTGREQFYMQQAGEQGPPADLTGPFQPVTGPTGTQQIDHPELLGDPTRHQDLPAAALESATTDSPSGAHRVQRTGNQPKAGK